MADMLNIDGPDVELKSIERSISQVFDAVVPETKSLIDSPELRPSSNAIQSKISPAVLPREFACVTEKRVCDIAALFVRVNGNLVDKRGRTIEDFRPEEAVVQLEPEDSDGSFIIKGCVVHPRANMLFHRRFVHLRGTPQRVTSFRHTSRGRTQYVGDETFLFRVNLAEMHRLHLRRA